VIQHVGYHRSKHLGTRKVYMNISLGKRVLALSFAVAIIGSLFAACGGDDDNSSPTTAAASTATIEASTAATASSATAAATSTPQPTTAASTAATAAPTDAASGLAGTWNGAYESTSDPGSTGTFVLDWTQTGSALSGTISVTNTPCVAEGTITGTTDGTTITFGAVQGAYSIAYEGTVSGDTMSGTYSSPSCGNAAGTWTANKQ
jgi:hypothetical protein